jgi:hypothetical protein
MKEEMESCEECEGERRVVDIEVNTLAGWKTSVQRSSSRDRAPWRRVARTGINAFRRYLSSLMDGHRNRGELLLQ